MCAWDKGRGGFYKKMARKRTWWNDFGATDGGFKIAVSYEKTEWEVDQENAPIDEFLTRWNRRLYSIGCQLSSH